LRGLTRFARRRLRWYKRAYWVLCPAVVLFTGLGWEDAGLLLMGFAVLAGAFYGIYRESEETFPRSEHSRRVGRTLVWYPTASFDRVLGGPTLTTFLPLFPALLYLLTSATRHPDFLDPRIAVALFLLSPLLVLLYLARYGAAAALGCVRVLRVRGSRASLLSLGYCEAELITDGDVEVSGFRELGSYPVKYRGLPGNPPGDLRVRVGYFPPGKHEVEARDCGFFFLRTRGFCLLYDSRGLPEDRERAFHLARWWEKFSMVYAALCLREGVPSAVELERWLGRVKNNRAVGSLVRYMNCWYYPKVVKQAFQCVIMLSVLIPMGFLGWRYGIEEALMGYVLSLPVAAFVPVILTLVMLFRGGSVARTGGMYESLLTGKPPAFYRRIWWE